MRVPIALTFTHIQLSMILDREDRTGLSLGASRPFHPRRCGNGFSTRSSGSKFRGGADRDRTDDLLNASQALSQLSYSPGLRIGGRGRDGGVKRLNADCRRLKRREAGSTFNILHSTFAMVGLGRFELPTSRLSGVRSNQLSYRPVEWRGRRLR